MLRVLLLVTGTCCVGLGVLGVFLPVLPTTPFLLLAAGCYARSSERMHQRLLASPVLGNLIDEWQTNGSIPRRSRTIAIGMIVICFGFSIGFVIPNIVGQLAMFAIGTGVVVFLCRLPVSDANTHNEREML